MKYIEENNELFAAILNEYQNSINEVNLIIEPYKCTNCIQCGTNEYIDKNKIKLNLNPLLKYLSQFNFNTLHINTNDMSILHTIYEFFKVKPISNIIKLHLNYKQINLDILNNIIADFEAINIKLIPCFTITCSSDLKFDIINFARTAGWEVRVELNHSTLNSLHEINDIPEIIYVENISDWTDEDADKYFVFITNLCEMMSSAEDLYNLIYKQEKYRILRLDTYNKFQCELQQSLNIRVQDLAIIPCGGLTENKFKFGNYILDTDNQQIIGVESNNVEFASLILTGDTTTMYPTCDLCDHKEICPKGCLKQYYDKTRDILMPIETICNFYKFKLDTLLAIYKKSGVLNYIIKNKL